MPIATNKTPVERLHDDIRDMTIHEKMYRLATEKGSTLGGSESLHK